MKSGFSEINGIRFYYETDGSGENPWRSSLTDGRARSFIANG